jgi:hypothetical protein
MESQVASVVTKKLVGLRDARITGYQRDGALLRVGVRRSNGSRLEVVFTQVAFVDDEACTEVSLAGLTIESDSPHKRRATRALEELHNSKPELGTLQSFSFRDLDGSPVLSVVAVHCTVESRSAES